MSAGYTTFTKTIIKKVSFTSAQILAWNTTPLELLPALPAGNTYFIYGILARMNFLTAIYAVNTNLQIYYQGAAQLVMVANATLLAAPATTTVALNLLAPALNTTQYITMAPLLSTVSGGDPTLGGGSIDFYISYQVLQQ